MALFSGNPARNSWRGAPNAHQNAGFWPACDSKNLLSFQEVAVSKLNLFLSFGRTVLASGMQTGRVIKVSFLVDEDVYEQLSAYAQLTEASIFDVIREGLTKWIRSMSISRHQHDIKMPARKVGDGPLPPDSH
ncbi:MAG TPA: hypothetical protein VEK33_18805 [Terriglobales bacterium]|nr:hypothetical protein [Terriglobales bacterium]